jgi:uncharacterized protein (DUF1800 family)
MTIGQDQAQAVTALNRFGLGARPGDLARASGDPLGFLLEELRTPNVALIRNGALRGGVAALQATAMQRTGRVRRLRAGRADEAKSRWSWRMALASAVGHDDFPLLVSAE